MSLHRSSRQEGLIPPGKFGTLLIDIIGVGAIGRQVAIQLAACGVQQMTLWDHDNVETVNLGPQAYFEEDVGANKVDATKAMCKKLNSSITVDAKPYKFDIQGFHYDASYKHAIFCCVDSIETRKDLQASLGNMADIFLDGRMGGQTCRIITVVKGEGFDYKGTLFNSSDAYAGSCTTRSSVFMANIAAGLMISSFAKWLRGDQLAIVNDFQFDAYAVGCTQIKRVLDDNNIGIERKNALTATGIAG